MGTNRAIQLLCLLAFAMAACLPALAADQVAATDSGWGNVSGRIVVDGHTPEPTLERVGQHKDRPVCLIDGQLPPDDGLVIGEDGGLRDVFIILVPRDKSRPIPIHPSYEQAPESALTLDNRNCRFVPHAMAIRTGRPLKLKNSDAVGHNCKITSFNNEHNVNLPAGGEVEIKLDLADRIPANVACDIHPWMDAVILAKDHPYVAITAADGSFEMDNVPAGKWLFQFWHQKGAYLRKLNVENKKLDRKARVELTVTNQQTLNLGILKLPTAALQR